MKGRETVQADIRERIRTAGYANLTKLALDLDLDYTALLNTLCGRTPSLRVIEALVKELGVPLESFPRLPLAMRRESAR